MRKVKITTRAAAFVDAWTKWAERQIGPGYVPVIDWVVMASEDPDFVPQLGLAFEKADVVDRSRVMECDGKDIEIFQYVPDELFGEHVQKFVDVRDKKLVLAEE
ncbi:MAG: hypothetical protein JOY64_01770 [Alphaproteobacteria bacterium]|nr:hypothetical protein [Alphaproteobacteria bacterium]MBV8406330.1 hypothetical protein [Alphaproteobacteria bacterium]